LSLLLAKPVPAGFKPGAGIQLFKMFWTPAPAPDPIRGSPADDP